MISPGRIREGHEIQAIPQKTERNPVEEEKKACKPNQPQQREKSTKLEEAERAPRRGARPQGKETGPGARTTYI